VTVEWASAGPNGFPAQDASSAGKSGWTGCHGKRKSAANGDWAEMNLGGIGFESNV
jgi:hypothetical protein